MKAMNEIEELRKKMYEIKTWVDAYPLKAFSDPDFVEVQKLLKRHGLSSDAISAGNMRYVLEKIKNIIETNNHRGFKGGVI